jgi:hypothetical protein
MTYDLVALTQRAPDAQALAESMASAGDALVVRGAGDGALIQLCDESGRMLVSIEAAQRVDVAGEVERLLGDAITVGLTVPYWWIEARAPEDVPDAPAVAYRFAAALTARLGGVVWPPSLA